MLIITSNAKVEWAIFYLGTREKWICPQGLRPHYKYREKRIRFNGVLAKVCQVFAQRDVIIAVLPVGSIHIVQFDQSIDELVPAVGVSAVAR